MSISRSSSEPVLLHFTFNLPENAQLTNMDQVRLIFLSQQTESLIKLIKLVVLIF